jgi:hypothetical protein
MATSDTSAGRFIITDIIPAIAELRSQYNIKFTTMFSYHLMLEHGIPLHITSSNISNSDNFFDGISFKYVPLFSILAYLITSISCFV